MKKFVQKVWETIVWIILKQSGLLLLLNYQVRDKRPEVKFRIVRETR